MSDTDGKVKIIRNPGRNKPAPYKPYVPQYQIEGIEPNPYQSAIVPQGSKVATPSTDNPRLKRAPVRQDYASASITSPIGKGPVPNVGNNMEHTWSSVDSEIVDDLSGQEIDQNHQMIDNNDFVTDAALGYQSGPTASHLQPNYNFSPPKAFEQEIEPEYLPVEEGDLLPILSGLDENTYLLIVSGEALCSGPKEEIEDQARALVFGEHEICDGNPIPVDDIIILKRVNVKVGLFLE